MEESVDLQEEAAKENEQSPARGRGYSLYWPIRGGSAREGYHFQASSINGRDFSS